MQARNKNILVKNNGNTKDIAETVMTVYNNDYKIVCELAKSLELEQVDKTCQNIFNYIIEHVKYIEDPTGVQLVKTPARLVSDGFGDCKSMAIFAASCLRCLEIEHVLRFVSFNNNKDATHVYVVAFDNNKEIIIDPVVRIAGKPKFNTESKYTYKSDMRGTDIYYMSGIPSQKNNQFWLGDQSEFAITPGKQFLYIKFNEIYELLNIAKTRREKASLLSQLQAYTALITGYNYVNGDTQKFNRIALIVSYLYSEKYFASQKIDIASRDTQLDAIIVKMKSLYVKNFIPNFYDIALFTTIKENVVDNNTEIKYSEIPNKSILSDLYNVGYNFAYMFTSEKYLNSEQKAIRNESIKQYNKILEVTFFTPETLESIFKTSFIRKFGKNPETLSVKDITKYLKLSVGTDKLDPFTLILNAIMLVDYVVKNWRRWFPKKV